MTRIVTNHIFPSIPIRGWDWVAYREGNEENTHACGYGTTEDEAIADMLRLEKEEAESEGRDGIWTLDELERELIDR